MQKTLTSYASSLSPIAFKTSHRLHTAWLKKADLQKLDTFQSMCLRQVQGIPHSYISRVSNAEVLRRAGEHGFQDFAAQAAFVVGSRRFSLGRREEEMHIPRLAGRVAARAFQANVDVRSGKAGVALCWNRKALARPFAHSPNGVACSSWYVLLFQGRLAHLLSHAHVSPNARPMNESPELTFPSEPLRALLLRRLRLPLPLSARTCRCRRPLDPLCDHRAACSRSGALRSRGCPLERAAARVCREAGARVTTNTLVRDLNVAVSRFDDRRIEVIANGLPLWNGAQLAVDTTIVSPLTAAGEARSRRDPARPVALLEARRRKEATYPELLASARCRLVVIGVEVGGRWGSEAASFLRLLARARARAAPEALRPALRSAYVHRWSGLLGAAASLAFADSLTSLPSPGLSNLDGPCPDLSDLLAACPSSPGASRLPAR